MGDACVDGACEAGTDPPCGTPTVGPCEEMVCNEQSQSCSLVPKPNGQPCTHDDLCTVNSTCQNGTCVGDPMDCSFAPVPNECHVAVCNPQNGQCEPQPGNNGQACIDPNDLCTVNKTCASGVCQGGQPKNCSYLTQGCLIGLCNTQNGQCTTTNAQNGLPCDDSDPCSTGESCLSGVCQGGTPITQCVGGDQCCPPGCMVSTDSDCNPFQIVLPAINRGWWRDDGVHNSGNDNTLTGLVGSTSWRYNSYFIFDLSAVTGTVVAAELWLEVENYTSPDPLETLSVWDVSTPAATLEANGTGQLQIYNDLMTGNQFATFTVQQSDVGAVKTISLSPQAVTDINSALGGDFSVGCHNDTISGTASQWARFSVAAEARIHQLVLTVI